MRSACACNAAEGTTGAEAALSYMNPGTARDWWEALTATEHAWAASYAREGSRLASFQEQYIGRHPD